MIALIVFVVALIFAHQLTPVVRAAARRFGVIDAPNPNNPGKIHKIPTPLAGGVAIYLGATIVILLFVGFGREMLALWLGATVMLGLGLVDDIFVIDWKPRMALQVVAATLFVLLADVRVPAFAGAYWALPLEIFWLVGVTNALNLMDNIDGATSGVTFLAGVVLFLVAPGTAYGVAALAIAGASLGFLRYNSKPASIFLGDTGTLFLGFSLGALSLMVATQMHGGGHQLLVFPLVLGMPIFDTSLATFLRIKNRRPIYLPDRSNLTYRLFATGMAHREVVLFEYLLAAFLGLCALALLRLEGALAALPLLAAASAVSLIGSRLSRELGEAPQLTSRPARAAQASPTQSAA